jgi:hypothetical protein
VGLGAYIYGAPGGRGGKFSLKPQLNDLKISAKMSIPIYVTCTWFWYQLMVRRGRSGNIPFLAKILYY